MYHACHASKSNHTKIHEDKTLTRLAHYGGYFDCCAECGQLCDTFYFCTYNFMIAVDCGQYFPIACLWRQIPSSMLMVRGSIILPSF